MNSGFSKFEKSVEECINYNFDDNSPHVKKSKRQLSRSKSKDCQVNGKSDIILGNWLEYKTTYCWLYLMNENPKCSICDAAIKECNEITPTSWTNTEMNLEKTDLKLDEEKILQIHMTSDNHVTASQFLSRKSIEIKPSNEFTKDSPNFISISEWNNLKIQFSWLTFDNDLFSCSMCEESASKLKKPFSAFNILGNSSQKNMRDFKKFEKHEKTSSHTKAIEILKDESQPDNSISIPNKDESKRVSNTTPRKSMIFSPPNVTTRTAIRKSLCDRNNIPDSIDEKSWNSLKSEFPWVYSHKNILGCSYCEDAFKNHNESMMSTSWTNPELSENRAFTSMKDLKSKYRLNQHESTKNHETATRVLSLFNPIKKPDLANESEIIQVIVESISTDFRIPSTVRASRKSAPVKLTNLSYDDKPSTHSRDKSNEEVKNFIQSQTNPKIKSPQKIDTSIIPSFLTQDQCRSIKMKYDWLNFPSDNSYSCSICLDAMKINPDALGKTRFTVGPDSFDSTANYVSFRKKLYRHSESRNHNNAYNIINRRSTEFLNESSQPKNQQLSLQSSPDSRFTRLKSGIKSKIDYKRMSEGFIQTNEKEYLYELANISTESPKKRKESSSVTWICPQCKSHFRNTDDLIQHISLCDYQPSDSTQQLACPCNPLMFRFNTITKLDLHAAQEHDNQSYFHCYICSDRYNRLTSLYHHMLIHHLISTWDPFEAYLPVKPSEQFLCLFCSCNFRSNLLLTKHYCLSDCKNRLQPIVILENISIDQQTEKCHIHEEVTVLDVEELPDEKSAVIYSPMKKSKSQHNRISRNHPLRRFGPEKKNKNKESSKKLDVQNTNQINQNQSTDSFEEQSNPKSIDKSNSEVNVENSNINENNDNIKIDENVEKLLITEKVLESNQSTENLINELKVDIKTDEIDKSIIISNNKNNIEINEKTEIDSKSLKEQNSDSINQKETEKDSKEKESKVVDLKIDQKLNDSLKEKKASKRINKSDQKMKITTNKIAAKNRNLNKFKTNKSNFNSPKLQTTKPIEMIHQVVDLNDIMNDSESKNLLNDLKINSQSNTNHAKSVVENSKLKKEPIRIQSQLSPCKKLKTFEQIPIDNDIPPGLSFMDRMKKIRQLKKNRTEQQREQMMAVDRKIAEINDKIQGPSIVDKSERIKKLLSSEQYSMNDLKSIIQLETKSKPEKRKNPDDSNESISVASSTPKQQKIDYTKSISPVKSENFSCNVCHLKFKSLRARDSHTTAEHKGLKLFCCKVCELSFTTHILLRKHAQKYHIDNVSLAVFGKENASEINFSFPCSFCPLQFTSRSGLNHHITSGHRMESDNAMVQNDFLTKLIAADPNFSPQSCLICQEIMNNEFELDIHTIEHQKECQGAEVEPTQFACPKCCRLFFGRDGKSYLKDHYNIIHLGKPLPNCEECETKFNSTVCYSMHRKFTKNCSKKTQDQLKIEDPYEKLNDPMKLAFVCSRCQTLIAGQSAETRFEEHKIECNAATDKNDDTSFSFAINSQSECVDGQ